MFFCKALAKIKKYILCPEPYPKFHPRYLCTPGYAAPNGFTDWTQPLSNVWMCGTQAEFHHCSGFKSSCEDSCEYFGFYGECLLAGRNITDKEFYSKERKP